MYFLSDKKRDYNSGERLVISNWLNNIAYSVKFAIGAISIKNAFFLAFP